MSSDKEHLNESIVWENPETPITVHDYVFQNGKRFVRPYFFEFIAHVKERWGAKTIVNLFAEEFRQRPLQYYVQAVDSGRILVDGKLVKTDYVVKASQTLSHFVHRHEPPVMADRIAIIEMDTDVVTVCKPSSVPVHACGQYRKNTVLGILQAEHDIGPLYPIHRLDRLVSGLLIVARNAHTADRFRQEIEAGGVQKIYVARVKGVFPDKEVELNAAIKYDAREGLSTVEEAENLLEERGSSEKGKKGENLKATLSDQGKALSHQGRGKHACTRFRRLHSDGVDSIIECMPVTGRTHQIRVHLQYLGHPIANDALYAVRNPLKRTERGTNAERAARGESNPTNDTLTYKRKKVGEETIGNSLKPTNQCTVQTDQSLSMNVEERELEDRRFTKDTSKEISESKNVKFVVDHMCTHCPNLAPSGYEEEEHALWLHCKSYSGKGWKYECPLPGWALLPSTFIPEISTR